MSLKTSNKSFARSEYDNIGIYVWEMPDGRIVADEDGNFLSISSMYGDIKRMSELKAAAQSYGLEGGQAKFMPGYRKVTDEEYEYQKERLNSGLIPDEYDLAAVKEAIEDQNGR